VADTALRRPGGRTARVREAVLRATVQELVEQGHSVLSLEAIARRAGVSKATLYRRWGGRDGLVLAAVEWYGVTQADVPDTGDFDQDLRHWAWSIQRMLNDVTAGALVLAVFTGDRTTTRPIRHRFWQARLQLVRPLVERAIQRKEIPADTDVDEVVRHLGAPLYYRFLVLAEPVTQHDADLAATVTASAARAGVFCSRPDGVRDRRTSRVIDETQA
jgi:AcrR family transcriptional regulator